jgi:3-phenylpropionate/trans-cinnamate dioxygenase ferredoxin subunit
VASHVVAAADELPPGSRRIIEVEGRSIGVFNVDGRFYALRNACPHQGAPLCLGSIGGTMVESQPGEYRWEREGEILRCPWHGWEFDLTDGKSVFNPHRTRVRSYRVSVRSPEGVDPSVETFPVSVEAGVVVIDV